MLLQYKLNQLSGIGSTGEYRRINLEKIYNNVINQIDSIGGIGSIAKNEKLQKKYITTKKEGGGWEHLSLIKNYINYEKCYATYATYDNYL